MSSERSKAERRMIREFLRNGSRRFRVLRSAEQPLGTSKPWRHRRNR